jgi:MFS transporter, MCT family, solute carrier family 16 (monocarboxylic acid transporters), member 12
MSYQYFNAQKHTVFRWLIVLGSFLVYFIADGVSLSFGIFTREFIDYFNKSDKQSYVFVTTGLLQACPLFLSPLICYLIERIECRPVALIGSCLLVLSFILTRFFVNSLLMLNITIGLMTSCGLAMIYIPAYLIISFHFDKRRALATGIAVSGSGLGLFVLSPLLEYFIAQYGWMDACFLFGAISSHTFISACLFRSAERLSSEKNVKLEDQNKSNSIPMLSKEEEEEEEEDNNNKRIKVKENSSEEKKHKPKRLLEEIRLIYQNKRFLIINLCYFILSSVIVTPHNFLPSYIKFIKIHDPSSISISLLGIFSLIGQIVIGLVSDIWRPYSWLIFSLCIMTAGFLTILLPLLTSLYMIYIYSMIFGFTTSVNYVLQSSLVIESLGMENFPIAFGWLQVCQGFSTLIGIPMLGWVKDETKSYDLTFYISGGLLVTAALVILAWPTLNS